MIIEEEKLSFNTQQYYCSAIYRHIFPVLGEDKKFVCNCTRTFIKGTGDVQNNPFAKENFTNIKKQFSVCVKKGYIKTKPAEMAAVIFLKSHNLSKQKRDMEWSVETIQMVLKQCCENFSEIYLPAVFSLMLGTRISETLMINIKTLIL